MDDIGRIARIARITVDSSMKDEIRAILEMFERLDSIEGEAIGTREGSAGNDSAGGMEGRGKACEEKGPRTV